MREAPQSTQPGGHPAAEVYRAAESLCGVKSDAEHPRGDHDDDEEVAAKVKANVGARGGAEGGTSMIRSAALRQQAQPRCAAPLRRFFIARKPSAQLHELSCASAAAAE